jgi:LysM repeat protein
LAAIARKSGVNLAALEAANPGVTPKKLHVGQALNLPQ